MSENHTFMPGEEFIQKLLAGERDFRRVRLEPYFNLSGDEAFSTLQEYLKGEDLENAPVLLERADLSGIDADGWHLPFVKANGIKLKHATLMQAMLAYSVFRNADFRYARLPQTSLMNCDLEGVDFRQADLNMAKLNQSSLKGADIAGTNLLFANLEATHIHGVVNLGLAQSVATANFQFVSLTEQEKSTIRMELWAQEGKKLRLFGGSG